MKKKITIFYGYVGFIGILLGIIIVLSILVEKGYWYIDNEDPWDFEEALGLYLISFILINLLFYLIHTRFWTRKTSEIKMIENENELLKRQIENEELKNKLNNPDNTKIK